VRTYTSGFLPAQHPGTSLTVPLHDKMLPTENLPNVSATHSINGNGSI